MVLDCLISEPLLGFESLVLFNVIRRDLVNLHFPEEGDEGTLERVSLDPLLRELIVRNRVLNHFQANSSNEGFCPEARPSIFSPRASLGRRSNS